MRKFVVSVIFALFVSIIMLLVELVIDRAGALTQEEAAQAEDDVEDCELV